MPKMKKAYINKFQRLPFNRMVDINMDIKQGKVKRREYTEKEKQEIANNMLKNEYALLTNKYKIKVDTDKHSTEIKFFDKFILLTEIKNAYTVLGKREVNKYIKYI